eukprot:TRINITY_DN6147_c0_g1_i4.p1 TRINITY_DN6147_c0_g1~~TRINITY_DN6147_c0_g1_i4.p1  ORF type:complete len:241 (-),score=37.16 TRINITY_DN6147_c0_g1_i4:421-1143(-)
MAQLNHKDIGELHLDVQSATLCSWESHGGYHRLRNDQVSGFSITDAAEQDCPTSWRVADVQGGTDPAAPCSVTLESTGDRTAKMTLSLFPFARMELEVSEGLPLQVSATLSLATGTASSRPDSEGPVRIAGLTGQQFMDMSEPDPEMVADDANQLNCRPGTTREYHWEPRGTKKQDLTLNLDDGPDTMLVRAHCSLPKLVLDCASDSNRWPEWVRLTFATSEPVNTTEPWTSYLEFKSRY